MFSKHDIILMPVQFPMMSFQLYPKQQLFFFVEKIIENIKYFN